MGERPNWSGVNHLALITSDMDATVRFWHTVLGAPLVATIATDSFKHYFFSIGPDQTVAFFEYKGVHLEQYSKPAGVPFPRAAQFDHLALNLDDEDALLTLRKRLEEYECEVTDVVDHGFIRSIYFTDPNGIALEASFWVFPAQPDSPDYNDERLFSDTAPVPAVAEITSGGDVSDWPRTRLVDGVIEDRQW